MNKRIVIAIGTLCLAPVLFSASEGTGKPQIVLLRTYVTTNTIPGYIGGPTIKQTIGTNGMIEMQPVNAVAVLYPPRTEIVTNYVLGFWEDTNAVEVLTAQKRKE